MSVEERRAHVAESSHWYDKDGNPAYEVPNASKPGEMRPTTLKDAKKLSLYPSVTTCLSILAKPQLERWKQEQVLLASLTLPKPEGINLDDWASAVIEDARRQSLEAMDLGTRIHAAIQGMYEGVLWEPEYEPYCYAVQEAMRKEFGDIRWQAEKSFSHPLQYGGKVDIVAENGLIVGDFKTSSLNGKKLLSAGYPDHAQQLAAYRLGLGLNKATLANIYISTSVPGEVHIKLWTEEEALLATNQWLAMLSLWKLLKNF